MDESNEHEIESKSYIYPVSGSGIVSHNTITESGSATITTIQFGKYKMMDLYLLITAAAQTHGDTLNFYVDFSPSNKDDGSALWVNVCHFNVIYGDGGAKAYHVLLNSMVPDGVEDITTDCSAGSYRKTIFSHKMRVRYDIVGGSGNASFAYELHYSGRD